MRKEYLIAGLVTLLWFLGLYVVLLRLDYIVAYWSILALSLVFFATGLIVPKKKGES